MRFPNPIRFCGFLIRLALTKYRNKRVFVPPKVEVQRLVTCRGCEDFDKVLHQCNKCTCFVPLKAKMAFEGCPKKKWLPWPFGFLDKGRKH